MATVYSPQDTIVGPIVAQLASIISTQITGIDRVYETIPDGPPEDNSVIIPLTQFEVLDETNGKLSIRLTFGVRHLFHRRDFGEAITNCYSYIPVYFNIFGAWINQGLAGKARLITMKNGGVSQLVEAGQAYVCLIINLQVLAEINIPIS